jgi:hypothetical protein
MGRKKEIEKIRNERATKRRKRTERMKIGKKREGRGEGLQAGF